MEACGHERNRLNNGDEQDDDPEITRGHKFQSTQAYGHSLVHQGDVYSSVVHNHGSQSVISSSSLPSGKKTSEILFQSLEYDRQDARLHNIVNAMPQTCRWLIKHKLFMSWTSEDWSEHNGFLWIKGKPGCGKSTLIKTALRHITDLYKGQGGSYIVLSYFFNARAPSDLEKSALGFYQSTVYSLLSKFPALKHLLEHEFAWKLRDGKVDSWERNELCNFLQHAFSSEHLHATTVYIFVDALDEGGLDDVRTLISQLDDLATHAAEQSVKLRICLSSRHFPEIIFDQGLEMIVEDEEAHEEDIKHYINKKLPGNSFKMKELQDEVQKRSDHVFLWVALVVSILKNLAAQGRSLHYMQERLQLIPPDLDGLFLEILCKEGDNISECQTLLRWVAFAFRPLTAVELYHAIICASGDGQFPPELPEPGDLERHIRNTSRGLVEISRTEPHDVQFIHETVRSFLLSKGLSMLDPTLASNLEALCHDRISDACTRYLITTMNSVEGSGDTEESAYEDLLSEPSLISYAVHYTYRHVEKAAENGLSQSQRLKRLQSDDGMWQHQSFRKWHDAVEGRHIFRADGDNLSLLYVLTIFHLPFLVKECLQLGGSVNTPGGILGTPLQAACGCGYEDIVMLLLEHGADVNMQGGLYGHAWVAAVCRYNFDIAGILRNHGATPSQEQLQRALLSSIANWSVDGVEAVIDAGGYSGGVNDHGRSAMAAAITKGNVFAIEALLNSSMDVDVSGALTAAASFGHIDLVDRLLEQYTWSQAELHEALEGAFQNYWRIYGLDGALSGIFRNLLAVHGLHVMLGEPGLSEAESLIANLLAYTREPDVSSRDHNSSAISEASEMPDEAMLILVADRKVNLDFRIWFERTPLMQAALYQHLDHVKALLDAGADPHLTDCHGLTALHLSLQYHSGTQIGVLNALLRQNPRITHVCNAGMNIAEYAVIDRRCTPVISRLIIDQAMSVGDTKSLLSIRLLDEVLKYRDTVFMTRLLELAEDPVNMKDSVSPFWIDILGLRRKLACQPGCQRDSELCEDVHEMLNRSSDPKALGEDLLVCGINVNIDWSRVTTQRSTANRTWLCWTDVLHSDP